MRALAEIDGWPVRRASVGATRAGGTVATRGDRSDPFRWASVTKLATASAALVALEEGPPRLHQDHENARRLAEGVAEAVPRSLDPELVETNIVFADPAPLGLSPAETAARLRDEGVLVSLVAGKVRMLTHRDVSTADVDEAIAAWRRIAPSG